MIKHKRRWEWIKLYPDIAFYAYCNRCQFYYPAYKNIEPRGIKMRPDVDKLFPYCPYCGKKMLKPVDNVHYREYNITDDTWESRRLGD